MITHPDESYYRDGRTSETERIGVATAPLAAGPGAIRASLAAALDHALPTQPLPMLIAVLVIVAGAAKLGWEAHALFGPIYEYRGWGALVVFSIVGSVYMVNYSNRRS